MSIRVLDEKTIGEIAAGEVIENPASVVKELIENSIDADARNIDIVIADGGLKLIRVSDDGKGFEKDDIKLAFLQHATSKLTDISDLEKITSYGFRGEALASISSVSNVVLITKRKCDNCNYGYKYSILYGIESSIEESAANCGTSIEVRDLFANVPVRKKFLKGFQKENALVEDIVIKFAISNPSVSFKLIIDEKLKFKSNGDGNLLNVLFALYGKQVISNLIDINEEINGIKICGYISKPIVTRNTRNDEIYFVNGRYIKSKIISKAIEGAYEEYLMQHKFPIAVLNIFIDSSKVDVNVHPKKLEVRFSNDELVYYAVYNVIHNRLNSTNLIHEEKLCDINTIDENLNEKNEGTTYSSNVSTLKNVSNIFPVDSQDAKNIDVDVLPSLGDENKTTMFSMKSGLSLSNFYDNLDSKFEEKSFIKKTLSDDHKYIGQVFNTYILIEFEEKLYIIDQHAAHEKINFEKIMSMYKNGENLSQNIIPSILLKLTPLQFEAVITNIDSFKKIGYEIEAFGDNEIKVDAVPYNIFNIGNEKLLMDMIDSFVNDKNDENYESIVEKIASISCKKSIKANYILSKEEVKELLKNLFKLENPYNCPHGRPTIISLSKIEFEKKFGRIV